MLPKSLDKPDPKTVLQSMTLFDLFESLRTGKTEGKSINEEAMAVTALTLTGVMIRYDIDKAKDIMDALITHYKDLPEFRQRYMKYMVNMAMGVK